MARAEIKYDHFKVKAFLDTNIILECRPLVELPWHEVDADGPILALVTPTTIKEIDSKKQDGRIGKHAREFNRLIAPVAAGGPPIVIRESAPRVELALSRAIRIPWDQHDDLDPDDGDSCIVAEVLHARDMSTEGKLIVSHDIKPIAFASSYDVPTLHVSDNWLRQPEPHPKDRRLQQLNHELEKYKSTEPVFEVSVEFIDKEPVTLVHIMDLSETERSTIESRIHDLNPQQDQARGPYGLRFHFDHTYEKRYKAYRRRVSDFMKKYSQTMERLFNQTRFRLKLVNTGNVQAENLLLEVNVTNGWLHNRFVFVSPQGPSAPEIRNMMPITTPLHNIQSMITPHVGRHEFEFKEAPNHGRTFSVMSKDFRHRQEYIFEGVVTPDARTNQMAVISVVVSASNHHGTTEYSTTIKGEIETVHVSKLIDLNSLKITAPVPMQEFLDKNDYQAIEWFNTDID